MARVAIADPFVRIAGGVDEITIQLELGQEFVHRLDLRRREQLNRDRRYGPVSEAAPGEGLG